jgi:hypothetical protein
MIESPEGGITVTPGGNDMEIEVYEWMPHKGQVTKCIKGLNKVLVVAKGAKK